MREKCKKRSKWIGIVTKRCERCDVVVNGLVYVSNKAYTKLEQLVLVLVMI